MSVVPVGDRSAKDGVRSSGLAPGSPWHCWWPACRQGLAPDRLRQRARRPGGRPGHAARSAVDHDRQSQGEVEHIRQDLEVVHGAPGAPPTADQLCASLAGPDAERDTAAQELERLHAQVEAERAGWRRSEAAADTELTEPAPTPGGRRRRRGPAPRRAHDARKPGRRARAGAPAGAHQRWWSPRSPGDRRHRRSRRAAAAEPEATPPRPPGPNPTGPAPPTGAAATGATAGAAERHGPAASCRARARPAQDRQPDG